MLSPICVYVHPVLKVVQFREIGEKGIDSFAGFIFLVLRIFDI